jgi:hypothetical protein
MFQKRTYLDLFRRYRPPWPRIHCLMEGMEDALLTALQTNLWYDFGYLP